MNKAFQPMFGVVGLVVGGGGIGEGGKDLSRQFGDVKLGSSEKKEIFELFFLLNPQKKFKTFCRRRSQLFRITFTVIFGEENRRTEVTI